MINVKDLTKCYGDLVAVNNISFKIESGHVYGLLGANGAGKSTTMNMLTGCLAPTSGSVRICGYDLASESEKAKANIGYLPETPPLYLDMTPREFLIFVAKAKKVSGDITSHIESIMQKTRISDVSDRLIKNLSKGYRQRVGIAQAMVGDPKIMILDEPTVGLDPRQIIEIRELISEIGRERTVIISSHILSEIAEICDRIIIISDGSIVAIGSHSELRQSLLGPDLLTLEVKASQKQTAEILKKAAKGNIASIEETKDSTCIATLECGDVSVRESIFFAFADAKKAIISMNLRTSSLEDLFLKATEESAAYPEDEIFENTAEGSENLPSIRDFFRRSASCVKSSITDSDDSDDSDDSYRPLFGRK